MAGGCAGLGVVGDSGGGDGTGGDGRQLGGRTRGACGVSWLHWVLQLAAVLELCRWCPANLI